MDKSPDAFRTISEVAEWLDTPTHVLRFWESRFTQVKPVKRAGGRRYYRPRDMELLGGIKKLLHNDGMTIRGVQKLLREEGVRHVSAMSAPIDGGAPGLGDVIDAKAVEISPEAPIELDVPPAAIKNVVTLMGHRGMRPEGSEATPPTIDEKTAPETPPSPPPLVADVPEDPADDTPARTSDISGVASALRAARHDPSKSITPAPEKFSALFERLTKLRARMGNPSNNDQKG